MGVVVKTRDEAVAELEALLRWLDGEPADQLPVELAELRARLSTVSALEPASAVPVPVFEALLQRLIDAGERVRAQLLTTAVPLPRELYDAVRELQAQLLELAGLAAARSDPAATRAAAADAVLVTVATGCLRGLHLVFVLSGLSAVSDPAGLWRLAHRFGELADGAAYRAMLALAACQPRSFSARELSWLADYFLAQADALRPLDGVGPPAAWHFDAAADSAPTPEARESHLPAARPRHVQLRTLLERMQHGIARLDEQIVAEAAAGRLSECASFDAAEGLPPGLAPTEMLALLRRLCARWEAVPVREHRRRPKDYAVEVCVGLGTLWELACGGEARGRIGQWRVLNEDPAGCAIVSVGECAAELQAGVLVGLRADRQHPWAACVVRWVHSERPGQVELGLQLLAPSFQAAQLAFRAAQPRVLVPALELPAMAPIRPRPAFVVPAGSQVGRSFVFVRAGADAGAALYLAQGSALGAELQTAAVELFQYELDLYPD